MDVATDPKDLLRKQADEIETLKTALSKLERENKRLSDELALLLRQLFHKKSERLDADQLRLFAEQLLGEQGTAPVPEEEVEKIASYERRKQGHGRSKFPAHLPRETVEIDLPEEERICPDCGEAMEEFGVETTERGHIIPARIVVRQYLRKKYACSCGHCVRTGAPAFADREVQVRDFGLRTPDGGEVRRPPAPSPTGRDLQALRVLASQVDDVGDAAKG